VYTDVLSVVKEADLLVVATPSAYAPEVLSKLSASDLEGKKVVSAIKGLLPDGNLFLNDYLQSAYGFSLNDYYTIMGPCHAEEVAAEKLSYLTFSGLDAAMTSQVASLFSTRYLNAVINQDIYGVQYAAVLKNIYALGAGMAHGLEYGDNFLSVFIANCADEMASFLLSVGIQHMEVGIHQKGTESTQKKSPNYAASVYLGDLLVTCYSLYSRNRTFGNMIGKGYSVRATQLELSMVAEGYYGSRSIYQVNRNIACAMPIAETIYRILWEKMSPAKGFRCIEETLV
jgi:glycerol-3-phosphate dehydrogenase (NAD(P)+)